MKEILQILIDNNYEAFIVGGYVRDYLLNRRSFDVDICTNANTNVIKKLFNNRGVSNSKYYSYHIKELPYNYDITTYRKELSYSNNKPSSLSLVNSVYEDLLRRDFTINTFLMDINNNVIDYLNAKSDLDKRIIKVVGDTYEKLLEDNTRILRAIRLSCELDFNLDNEIICFLKEKSNLIKDINNEFKKKELDKIFMSNPSKFFMYENIFDIKSSFDIDYNNIKQAYDYYGVWAQLKHNYNLTKEEKKIISKIIKLVNSKKITRYDIYLYGKSICLNASSILEIDINDIINDLEINSVFDIDITFEDIKKIINISSYNKVIKDIEKNIVNKLLKNNKSDIIKYIKEKYNE